MFLYSLAKRSGTVFHARCSYTDLDTLMHPMAFISLLLHTWAMNFLNTPRSYIQNSRLFLGIQTSKQTQTRSVMRKWHYTTFDMLSGPDRVNLFWRSGQYIYYIRAIITQSCHVKCNVIKQNESELVNNDF